MSRLLHGQLCKDCHGHLHGPVAGGLLQLASHTAKLFLRAEAKTYIWGSLVRPNADIYRVRMSRY